MVPGFRYHVATIAAVFLALGVGIIIGSSFVQSAIVERQTHQVAALREQFRTEIAPAREEIVRKTDALARIKPILLQGRLAGARVALLQTGDYPDTVRRVRETLDMAGATVNSVTVLDRGFPTRAQTNLARVLPRLQAAHPNLPADTSSLLRVLAVNLSHGGQNSDLAALADANLIAQDGDYTRPNDFAILVGGATLDNDSRVETLDVPLIAQLKQAGLTVAAVEPEVAEISYIPVLSAQEITTVDNADTDIGGIALALALRGERGNYGVKPTAHGGLLPPAPPVR